MEMSDIALIASCLFSAYILIGLVLTFLLFGMDWHNDAAVCLVAWPLLLLQVLLTLIIGVGRCLLHLWQQRQK